MSTDVPRNDMEIVTAIRAALSDRVGPERFELWFGPATQLRLGAGALTVAVADGFFQQWLRQHFRGEIEAACVQVSGRDLPVEFVIDASLAARLPGTPASDDDVQVPGTATDRAAATPKEQVSRPAASSTSRRKFAKLQQFVVGNCNRLAHTSAKMVAESPGTFSPLLIHGPTGIGKTHLLEGIWSAAKQARPAIRAVYLSAEQFTSYFLGALHGSGLPSFRRKYRGVELLIVDDVQFFVGKRATLVELLHTIDTLMQEGRQLVFAADRPAEDLAKLGPELGSRITSGLVCRLERPELSTRLEMVKQLARRLDLAVPRGVRSLIAENLTSHVRQLQGALNRLKATSHADECPVTRSMAEQALADLFRANRRIVALADIEQAVCETFGLDARTLKSSRTTKAVSYPRMLAMWLSRKYTRAALSEIGEHFGGRSHSTVVSAQKKIEGWMSAGETVRLGAGDWDVQEAVRRVEANLRVG